MINDFSYFIKSPWDTQTGFMGDTQHWKEYSICQFKTRTDVFHGVIRESLAVWTWIASLGYQLFSRECHNSFTEKVTPNVGILNLGSQSIQRGWNHHFIRDLITGLAEFDQSCDKRTLELSGHHPVYPTDSGNWVSDIELSRLSIIM